MTQNSTQKTAWSIHIPASRRGMSGVVPLVWGVFFIVLFLFSGSGRSVHHLPVASVFAIVGMLILAIVTTINAHLIKAGRRGGLLLDPDGFTIQRGWRSDSRHKWSDIACFDTLDIPPNDGPAQHHTGFYPKRGDNPHEVSKRFSHFPEELALPTKDLLTLLNHVLQTPVEERPALPREISELIACASEQRP